VIYPARRVQVYERARARCEALACSDCSGRCEQVHHIAGRGGEDPHALTNLLGVCAACHAFIHAHPQLARERGWMISRHRIRDRF
jgi:hypothetical protein